MADSRIKPELYKFVDEQKKLNAQIYELSKAMPPLGTIAPEKMRNFRVFDKYGNVKLPLTDGAYNKDIQLSDRNLTVRIFPVESSDGTFIHFHGGGWVLGSIYEQESYLERIAKGANVNVISVDYPLAPKYKMPEILKVAAEALGCLVEEYAALPIIVGGESAGAHVAISSVLRLKEDPRRFSHIAGLNLCYGLYDLSMTPSQRNWGSGLLNLSTDFLHWFYDLALPDHLRDNRSHPNLSPLYADLKDMPRARFIIGELDALYDDTLFMYSRWQAAGNEGELEIYPGAPHGFNGAESKMADHCNTEILRYIKDCIANYSG